MQTDVRREARKTSNGGYCLTWVGEDGLTYSTEGRGVDVSQLGLRLVCSREVPTGFVVYLQGRDNSWSGNCLVRHCSGSGTRYAVGLEFVAEEDDGVTSPSDEGADEPDYYDVLQISPKADTETVHRVFKIMAARFHPDNPETGNLEEFLRLKRAYSVLSDPQRRQEYDVACQSRHAGPMPIFELKDFVTGVEAEANRRLGVLSLLYNQRRRDPEHPGVSLLDLEQRMAFPREHLSFTMWYLRAKQFVSVADNSDYFLTVEGAEFVEANVPQNDVLSKLLLPAGTRLSHGARKGHDVKPHGHRAQPRRLLMGSANPKAD